MPSSRWEVSLSAGTIRHDDTTATRLEYIASFFSPPIISRFFFPRVFSRAAAVGNRPRLDHRLLARNEEPRGRCERNYSAECLLVQPTFLHAKSNEHQRGACARRLRLLLFGMPVSVRASPRRRNQVRRLSARRVLRDAA